MSNGRRLGGEPRAMRLARRFAWEVDPDRDTKGDPPVCIEVAPHTAMVGLFGLGYRIAYTKGGAARRKAGFTELVRHLEAVTVLALGENARWRGLASMAADPSPGGLDRIEDEIDAVVCAHVAWLWHHRRGGLRVYGATEEGFIVAPQDRGRLVVELVGTAGQVGERDVHRADELRCGGRRASVCRTVLRPWRRRPAGDTAAGMRR